MMLLCLWCFDLSLNITLHLADTFIQSNNKCIQPFLRIILSQLPPPPPCLLLSETLYPALDVLFNNLANFKDAWKFVGTDGYIVWSRSISFRTYRHNKLASTDAPRSWSYSHSAQLLSTVSFVCFLKSHNQQQPAEEKTNTLFLLGFILFPLYVPAIVLTMCFIYIGVISSAQQVLRKNTQLLQHNLSTL